jgi:hypothetical protein
MQAGVAEYNSSTLYYKGSLCMSLGQVYVSLQESNQANQLTNNTYWKLLFGGSKTVTSNTQLTFLDEIIRSNSTSGNLTHTLPAISQIPFGKQITIKDVGTGGNTTTVQGSGSDQIDGSSSYQPLNGYDSVTVYNNGSSWDVI